MEDINIKGARGYTLNVENPPLSSGLDINENPDAMWNTVESEGSVLGFFPPCWYGIYTGRQAVPENDPIAFNFMISPRKGNFSTPQSLTENELAAGMSFVKEFLNNTERFAGFNISEEKRGRRDQVQSWANFHIHCVNLPNFEKMEPMAKMPDKYREKLPRLTGQLLAELLAPTIKLSEGMIIEPSSVKTEFILPKAGLLLKLSDNITPHQMALLVKKIDTGFRMIHQEVYSLFVKNFGERDNTGNPLQYELRDQKEISKSINLSRLSPEIKKSLIRVANVLKSEDNLVNNSKIFQLPTYSLDMFIDKDGYLHAMLFPYLLRRLGPAEILGVYLNSRFVEGSPNEMRKQRAKQCFEKTVERISVQYQIV